MHNHQLEQGNFLQTRRQQIRNRIRNDQIYSYFQSRRKELMSRSQFEAADAKIKQHLQTEQSRDQFLRTILQKFKHRQPSCWNEIIDQLLRSIPCFEGCFTKWIHYQILDYLLSVFKVQFSKFGFQHKVVNIFCEMTLHSRENNCDSNAYFLRDKLIEDMMRLLGTVSFPIIEQQYFIRFFAHLCSFSQKIRRWIIFHCGNLILQYAHQIIDKKENQQLQYNLLGFYSQFIKIFIVKDKQLFADFNFIKESIEIFTHLLHEKGHSKRVINQALCCLLLGIKSKSLSIYSIFANSITIISDIFQCLKYQQCCQRALNIVSFLAYSQDQKILKQILKFDILDILNRLNDLPTVTISLRVCTLNILINISCQTQIAFLLVSSPIWHKVCNNIIDSNNLIREEATFCAINVIDAIPDFDLRKKLIKQNKIVEKVMVQLQDTSSIHYYNSLLALQFLQRYIETYRNNNENNAAVDILESVYRLSTILNHIIYENKSESLVDYANKLYDLMSSSFVVRQC